MVLSLLSMYLRRPHAATSNEPWAVLAFADFPLAPLAPRCPRSFAPLPHSRPAQRSVALPNLPYGPCRPNPPVWPVSALAGPATGCRCISLCSGEQLKMCAGWGVQTSWRTSRPVAILSTHCAVVPCCARVAPCATCSMLPKVPKRSPVPELTQPISGRVELQAVSAAFLVPHALGYAVHGLCSRPSPWPSSWLSLGRPRSSPARSTSGPAPPRTSRLVLAVARPSPPIAHRAASLARRPQRRYAKNPGSLAKFAALQRITLATGRPPAAASPSICVRRVMVRSVLLPSAPSARLLRVGRWSAVTFEETSSR